MKKHFEDFKYQKSPHTKMIITVGGTSEARSYNFPEMASNPESRAYFIKNIVDLALDWEADGLDIDWEWGYRPSTQEHKDGYEMLMKELIESARPEGLLISNAISPSAYFGDNTPIGAIEDSDYLVVMSYSYSGGWSASSGHHSGLDKSEELGFNYWKGRGLDEEKIHVGIPFYGNRFRGASAPGQGFEEFSAVTHQQVQDFISEGYSLIEDDTSGSYIYSSSPEDIVFLIALVT
ncbi:chitinase [Vibrio astriarenae]|nr:chitinase [Vibrio sp. C7]